VGTSKACCQDQFCLNDTIALAGAAQRCTVRYLVVAFISKNWRRLALSILEQHTKINPTQKQPNPTKQGELVIVQSNYMSIVTKGTT
jgi:hypothetical protein